MSKKKSKIQESPLSMKRSDVSGGVGGELESPLSMERGVGGELDIES